MCDWIDWQAKEGLKIVLGSKFSVYLTNINSQDWGLTKGSSHSCWNSHDLNTKQCWIAYEHSSWPVDAMQNAANWDLLREKYQYLCVNNTYREPGKAEHIGSVGNQIANCHVQIL